MKQNKALVVLAFLAIYIVWGTTYVAILYALEGFPPFLISALRFSAAGLLLLSWCLFRGEPLPKRGDLKVAAVSGVVMLIGGSGLVGWSEQYITSSQAAIVVATEPFLFLLFDKKRRAFYFTGKRVVAGLLTGFSGMVLFFLFASSTANANHAVSLSWKMIGYAVVVLSAVLWVTGSLYSKSRLSGGVSNTAVTTLQLVAAGMASTIISGATGEWVSFSFAAVSLKAWGGLLYLVLMGSVVAYLSFTWLLSIRPPAQVSTHTYVNPVVAVLMGWLLAGEKITALQIGALALILIGVMLVNKKNDVGEKNTEQKPALALAE